MPTTALLQYIASTRASCPYQGLDLQVVDTPEEADFILAHGTEAVAQSDGSILPASLEQLRSLMERAAAEGRRRDEERKGRGDSLRRDNGEGGCIKSIPMVIANPDFVTVEERALRVMPGEKGCSNVKARRVIRGAISACRSPGLAAGAGYHQD